MTDKWNGLLLGSSIALNLFTWVLVWRYVDRTQPLIPIHYNITLGIDRIGRWQETMIFPGLGSLIIIVNALIAWFFKSDSGLSKSILFATLFIQIIISLGLGFLVLEFV